MVGRQLPECDLGDGLPCLHRAAMVLHNRRRLGAGCRHGLAGSPSRRFDRKMVVRLIVAFAVVAAGLVFLDRWQAQERAAERRAIEARENELAARAASPGSGLGCLDAAAGDAVESLCERALFATPESTAGA